MNRASRWIAGLISLYGLYWVVGIVEPFVYRATFLLLCLALAFLGRVNEEDVVPSDARDQQPSGPGRQTPRFARGDVALTLLAAAALLWPLLDLRAFTARAATPTATDVVLGAILIVLVLEATRRTIGWILPATAIIFIAYAYFGPLFDLVGLGIVAHRGYPIERLIGTQYMTLEGIFGVPLDVASTYLVLFTVFGAVLERTGAARFYVDWAMAAMGRGSGGSGAGRAVVGAGFLLGMVSGSGVATTVTLGSCAGPILTKAGHSKNTAGAILAASGIGAILAPPALGAAAFLIAEFLGITYRAVVVMAIIPAILYYFSALLMIETDSRRSGAHGSRASDTVESVGTLTKRFGYYFVPPLSIAVLLAIGMSAFRAVVIATIIAAALSWLRRDTALTFSRAIDALVDGGRAIVPVVATTATAGIIVGIVTLTGLGLELAGIIVELAGGSPTVTVLLAAVAVWVLGLAVPVTASYIIAAVMIVPALTHVGVPAVAAHMFVFYYAVLSEVTPPTALAPFAAAAITGGNAYRTMMLTWKYTLPAFLVPLVITLSPRGLGLLLQGSFTDVLWSAGTAAIGIVGLAAGIGGWILRPASTNQRVLMIAGGTMMFFPGWTVEASGVALMALGVVLQLLPPARVQRARAE